MFLKIINNRLIISSYIPGKKGRGEIIKKTVFLILFVIISISSWACSVCEKQQPKVLQGITHGTGPQSQWDYVIISITAVIVVATLFFSVKWLIRPGEKERDHIKRIILNNN